MWLANPVKQDGHVDASWICQLLLKVYPQLFGYHLSPLMSLKATVPRFGVLSNSALSIHSRWLSFLLLLLPLLTLQLCFTLRLTAWTSLWELFSPRCPQTMIMASSCIFQQITFLGGMKLQEIWQGDVNYHSGIRRLLLEVRTTLNT